MFQWKKDMDENKTFFYKYVNLKVSVQKKRECVNLDFLFEDHFSKVQLWLYKRDSRRTSKSQGTFDLNFHVKNGVWRFGLNIEDNLSKEDQFLQYKSYKNSTSNFCSTQEFKHEIFSKAFSK